MSKLYFRYGAMNCGKSSALMQVAHNYEENDKVVRVIKSKIDTKNNDKLSKRCLQNIKFSVLLICSLVFVIRTSYDNKV